MLVGRDAERTVVDSLIAQARTANGGALVLRGEAGIGKTALLDHAAASAGDFRLLRGSGTEAETEFAYAITHQLVRPLWPLVELLPERQAQALGTALGLVDGPAPDRFLVALGVLSLLAEAAHAQPVLCLVDDLQWCDSATVDVVRFVGRRLSADPVALVLAIRDEPGGSTGFPPDFLTLSLAGLDPSALSELLPGVPGPVRAVLAERTRGNPLALGEAVRMLTDEQLDGRRPLPDPLPVGDRLDRAFVARVRRLSAAAQTLVLVAAAEESGEADIIAAAVGESALPEAEHSGLLSLRDGRLEFAHPLIRSAVYAEASPDQRRWAHRRLAEALTARDRGDHATQHRAAAAMGPDATVAAALGRVGDRARGRSGFGAAATAYERAAELTPDPAGRARHLLAAADAAWLAGQSIRVRGLIERATAYADDPDVAVPLARLRGRLASRAGEVDQAYRAFREGAALADGGTALELLASAVEAADYAGDPAQVAEAARLARDIEPGPGPSDQIVAGFLAMAAPGPPDAGRMRAALIAADQSDDPRLLVWAGVIAVSVGDVVAMQRCYRRAVQAARADGAIGSLPYPLEHVAMSEAIGGNYRSARAAAQEGLRLARETGQDRSAAQLQAILAFIGGTCGDEGECRGNARATLDWAGSRGLGLPVAVAGWGLGRLDLALGRHEEALERLATLRGYRPGGGNRLIALWSTPDLAEAAARAGRPDDASEAVERLAALAGPAPEPALAATLAWCRGLLGDDDPEESLTVAADIFHRLHIPHAEARTRYALGEQLRRNRQRVLARRHLRDAYATFARLGCDRWAERAAVELRAAGDVVGAGAPTGGFDRLTPQELQIVRLVCDGASNRDAAAQLFISPRTVEYHLYKAYPKLGISSRTQLVTQFASLAHHR